jgi:predicted CopG family antitoxin
MSHTNKRIPVTEERWQELNELKDAGQTYDELLDELVRGHREGRLAEMVREKRDDEFVEVDPDDW